MRKLTKKQIQEFESAVKSKIAAMGGVLDTSKDVLETWVVPLKSTCIEFGFSTSELWRSEQRAYEVFARVLDTRFVRLLHMSSHSGKYNFLELSGTVNDALELFDRYLAALSPYFISPEGKMVFYDSKSS